MKEAPIQSASLEKMKLKREEIRRELTLLNRKKELFYQRFYDAWRGHERLKAEFEKLDRKIFEQDPGITVLAPKKAVPTKRDPAKARKPEVNPADVFSQDTLKAMIEELMAAKQSE